MEPLAYHSGHLHKLRKTSQKRLRLNLLIQDRETDLYGILRIEQAVEKVTQQLYRF